MYVRIALCKCCGQRGIDGYRDPYIPHEGAARHTGIPPCVSLGTTASSTSAARAAPSLNATLVEVLLGGRDCRGLCFGTQISLVVASLDVVRAAKLVGWSGKEESKSCSRLGHGCRLMAGGGSEPSPIDLGGSGGIPQRAMGD